MDADYVNHPIPISERVEPEEVRPYKKRKADAEVREIKVTLRSPIHGTECTVKLQTEDGGTIGRRSYARAWEKLCPSYGPDNECECGGVHADPVWLVSPDGPLQVGDAPLYTRCDWLVTRRPMVTAGGTAWKLACRFGAWFFTSCVPYAAVYSFVCIRGLFGFLFSWKLFAIIMLCVSLIVAEYILRAQP